MILSVIVVSYNVKFFLEQSLSSLKAAVEGCSFPEGSIEVFVVDNDSSDGTLNFLQPLFPDFHFICNKENTGFAKANNQALHLCRGEFVLFLNPDTILAEDSLEICVSFFRNHPDAGGVGVRMVDGTGEYLRESKRGFPGAAASFFKMSGLSTIFPNSAIFSAYYMGHLPENSSSPVDILSGAFMMARKSVLDKTGGFDEQFFMYAEDIDLSFRISKAGFRNYYLPATTIIHFKGESTRKDFRYVKMFYAAMQLFMKKHFNESGFSFQSFILSAGMRGRQALSFIALPFKKLRHSSNPVMSFILKGDAEHMEKLKMQLAEKHVPVTRIENKGTAIIFCQSDLFPWKLIISEIAKKQADAVYYFHGAGTHSMVSSHSSRDQGDVIEL
jgi:N-acetylglucosaminyl-diphospho-decaprenol L-rhamnosyltransferase